MKLTKPESREPLRKSEKRVRLLSSIVQLFVPLNGAVWHPYAGVFLAAVAPLGIERTCVRRPDRQKFCLSLKRVSSISRLLKENASCREVESIFDIESLVQEMVHRNNAVEEEVENIVDESLDDNIGVMAGFQGDPNSIQNGNEAG